MIENSIGYIAAALAAIMIYIVAPAVRARIGAERYDLLRRWVAAAVSAAEQVFRGAGMGAEKKEYALALLGDKLRGCSEEEAEALLEAEVYRLQEGGSHV